MVPADVAVEEADAAEAVVDHTGDLEPVDHTDHTVLQEEEQAEHHIQVPEEEVQHRTLVPVEAQVEVLVGHMEDTPEEVHQPEEGEVADRTLLALDPVDSILRIHLQEGHQEQAGEGRTSSSGCVPCSSEDGRGRGTRAVVGRRSRYV